MSMETGNFLKAKRRRMSYDGRGKKKYNWHSYKMVHNRIRMIKCILMCGGRGSRLNSNLGHSESSEPRIEKPLLKLCQKPLIQHIIETCEKIESDFKIFTAVSPNTKKTREYIKVSYSNKVTILDTKGKGFSSDYKYVLQYFENSQTNNNNTYQHQPFMSQKILFLPIDLPLISIDTLKQITGIKQKVPLISIVIEKEMVARYGFLPTSYTIRIENKEYCYSGISMVDSSIQSQKINSHPPNEHLEEKIIVINKPELAFNINTHEDLVRTENYIIERNL